LLESAPIQKQQQTPKQIVYLQQQQQQQQLRTTITWLSTRMTQIPNWCSP